MKCWKCGCHMEKDTDSRTAYCPNCGRTVTYRTKGDKNSYYDDSTGDDVPVGCLIFGLLSFFKGFWIFLLILVGIGLLMFLGSLIFGSGFWTFLEGILGFVWQIIAFLFTALMKLFGWLFSAIGWLFGLIF